MPHIFEGKHYPYELNLGCGRPQFHIEGWINIDSDFRCKPDLIMDVTHEPWEGTKIRDSSTYFPFHRETVQTIHADNLLEHIGWGPRGEDLLMRTLNSCHLYLREEGRMWFRVPDFEEWPRGALRDPTHRRFFIMSSIDYWDADHQTYKNYGKFYGYLPWRILSKEKFRNSSNGAVFIDVMMTPLWV